VKKIFDEAPISDMAFSPFNEERLATASKNKENSTIKIW
jgi:hypothetical protein